MQSQYPDVTVLETLAAKMELPVEKICVRQLTFLCSCLLTLLYTGMDKTSLDTSSGSLFVRDSLTLSGCPRHVGRNYVPLLFGVDTIECRLTLLRNT